MSDKNTLAAVKEILDMIDARPYGVPYVFEAELRGDVMLMSAIYSEEDIATGKQEIQRTRKWFISGHATESEIVQTALKCILTSAEHNVREHFSYGGTLVFGPHISVSKLLTMIRQQDSIDHREVSA